MLSLASLDSATGAEATPFPNAFPKPGPHPGGEERAQRLADLGVEALIAEATLTPKPALVDRRGSGAHRDLDMPRLLRSAHALHGTFLQMARISFDRKPDAELREQLAWIGRAGEHAMLEATGGSNAHRGAIWAIGLLTAGAAMLPAHACAEKIARMAARIAQLPDRFAPKRESNGTKACKMYSVGGARGEAAAGFPHALQFGLPALRVVRKQGASEDCARLDALMAIMSHLPDTCLLHRGGWPALKTAQAGAQAVLAAGGSATMAGRRALLQLDAALVGIHASPGGSADLLAATLFLDRVPGMGARGSTHPPRQTFVRS
jgi:triphosphoribosyl-dephospho-CoA synthase